MTHHHPDRPRWIDYMPLSAVRPAVRNPKTHAEAELQDSLAEFGYSGAMTLDERTGRLVAGHGRYGALVGTRERGESPPEGVLVDPETGEWLVPVERGWASKSDQHAEVMLLLHNKLQEAGGWNHRELMAMLDDLTAWDPTVLDRLAISEDEMDQLLGAFKDPAEDENERVDDPVDDEPTDLTADPEDGDTKNIQCPACGHMFPSGV